MEEHKKTIIGILASIIIAIITVINIKDYKDYFPITLILLFALILLLIFGSPLLTLIKYKFNKVYSEFIYEDFDTILEFMDDQGKKVSVFSSVELNNISLRFQKSAKTVLYTDVGKVKAMSRNGSDIELIKDEGNKIVYQVNFSKNNVTKKKTKFCYSAIFEESFNQENNNFWETGPKYFCKKFTLTLISQDKDDEISCYVKRGVIPKGEKGVLDWYLQNNISYITYNKYGKKLIKITLNKIRDNERYRIYWNITKPV